jgi:hypothetical protein
MKIIQIMKKRTKIKKEIETRRNKEKRKQSWKNRIVVVEKLAKMMKYNNQS